MSELKAAPESWRVGPSASLNRLEIEPAIGCVYGAGDELWRHARLIAASPDLYAALDHELLYRLLGMLEDGTDTQAWSVAKSWIELRNAALAKARGEL